MYNNNDQIIIIVVIVEVTVVEIEEDHFTKRTEIFSESFHTHKQCSCSHDHVTVLEL